MRLQKERHKLKYSVGSEYHPDSLMNEMNFLVFQKSYINSYYFRYSHVLYRITPLEKSERFDSLPHDFI